MRKMFSLFLAVLCLVLLYALTAGAQEAEIVESGKFGSSETAENVKWDLYSDGTLIFHGKGAMKDSYSYAVEGWHSHLADVKHVIFEEGITYIGAYIFDNNRSSIFDTVETITLPASVTAIGENAFNNLPGLKGVYISDLAAWCRIKFDGTGATPLSNNVDLYVKGERVVDLVIPSSVTSLPDFAFYGSAGIHTVTVHGGVREIGSFAFNSSSCLKHLIFQGNGVSFGEHVFTLSELTIHYPAGKSGWNAVVNGNYGGTVTWSPYEGDAPQLPEEPPCPRILWDYDEATQTLTLSGYGHTGDFVANHASAPRPEWDLCMNNAVHLVVEEGITGLGDFAFYGYQNLTSVSLPSTLKTIGEHAFDRCIGITELILPEGLTHMEQYAFQNTSITSVTIPSTVRTISYGLFQGCDQLRSITLHDQIVSIEGAAFLGCGITELTLPANLSMLGSNALENTPLTHIIIPKGVTQIYPHTFSGCSNLSAVELHDGITEIGDYAFRGCTTLTEIDLPKGLLTLGTQAFVYSGLTDVTVPFRLMHYGQNALGYIGDITFTGKAPEFAQDCFIWQDVTVRYPDGYSGWAQAIQQQYGGTVTWVPYDASEEEPEGHVHEYVEYTPPADCESWTVPFFECICGHFYEGDPIPPKGHQWGAWQIVFEPTPELMGEKVRTCIVCGNSETVFLPYRENVFSDVALTDYFYEPVLWAVDHNITAGTGNGNFSPNATCTRGQVVTFLWRALGEPKPSADGTPFTDVPADAYYYDAVLWAVEQGITSGTGNGKFSPDDSCTRGQVVTFLWRAMDKAEPESRENPFGDVTENDYFFQPVLWAVENQITAGTGAGRFSPGDSCTRGQVVTFLYRALESEA